MRRRSTIFFWLGLAVALILVAYFGGRQRSEGPPLDPTSTGPFGTRALTELVEAFGGSVSRGTPSEDTDVTLVLFDRLGETERLELERWVRNGGLLVVADPSSPLSPSLAELVTEESLDRADCNISELGGVNTLEADSFIRYSVGARSGCFGSDGLAYVVDESFGEGRIISLGGAVALTNQNLDRADNAVLVVNLLVQGDGAVAIIYDPGANAGERALSDLIPTPVRWFGWQLLVTFAIYVIWRARRFGGVVSEPQLVEMPGSLLVRATGELSRRAGGHHGAGARLRRDLEWRLRSEYRLPPDVDQELLVQSVTGRSSVDPGILQRVLAGPLPSDAASLTAMVADIDAVSSACLRPRTATQPSETQPSETQPSETQPSERRPDSKRPLVGSAND